MFSKVKAIVLKYKLSSLVIAIPTLNMMSVLHMFLLHNIDFLYFIPVPVSDDSYTTV